MLAQKARDAAQILVLTQEDVDCEVDANPDDGVDDACEGQGLPLCPQHRVSSGEHDGSRNG